MKQQKFSAFKKTQKAFGGALLKKGNPRGPRPISAKHAMHIVMRSSLAVGHKSFRNSKNEETVNTIVKKTS